MRQQVNHAPPPTTIRTSSQRRRGIRMLEEYARGTLPSPWIANGSATGDLREPVALVARLLNVRFCLWSPSYPVGSRDGDNLGDLRVDLHHKSVRTVDSGREPDQRGGGGKNCIAVKHGNETVPARARC